MVLELAQGGYRTLGVARSDLGQVENAGFDSAP